MAKNELRNRTSVCLLSRNIYWNWVGGIGVIGILVASLIPNLKRFKVQLRLGLGFVVSMMLIGYFVTNHDLQYISEDYLGIITKLAEIGLLQQLLTNVDSRES